MIALSILAVILVAFNVALPVVLLVVRRNRNVSAPRWYEESAGNVVRRRSC